MEWGNIMLNNKKINIGIVLLLVSAVLITLTINNTKYNRYVSEDMRQSISRLDESFSDNRSQLYDILHSNQEPQVEGEQLDKLINFHRNIERELFNLKKKGRLLKGDVGKRMQAISDEFSYGDQMNSDEIQEYYMCLNNSLGEDTYLELDKDEVKELELIFRFYNNTKDELSELKI